MALAVCGGSIWPTFWHHIELITSSAGQVCSQELAVQVLPQSQNQKQLQALSAQPQASPQQRCWRSLMLRMLSSARLTSQPFCRRPLPTWRACWSQCCTTRTQLPCSWMREVSQLCCSSISESGRLTAALRALCQA